MSIMQRLRNSAKTSVFIMLLMKIIKLHYLLQRIVVTSINMRMRTLGLYALLRKRNTWQARGSGGLDTRRGFKAGEAVWGTGIIQRAEVSCGNTPSY